MMHLHVMREDSGDLNAATKTDTPCRQCGKVEVTVQTWESHDGAYEDYKFTCGACGHVWWIDGIDS